MPYILDLIHPLFHARVVGHTVILLKHVSVMGIEPHLFKKFKKSLLYFTQA